ncbi:hypothetical protein [Streptomyces sp. M92]|uniref:hypothetical protein n=1 Tax=Streptomyces sp. M92 TaxID=2944250 RepID=UPI00234A145E|nr:hypothetical protein [Streptomyces sp. M92]WCN06073.1 hypothetical protein M6G08_30525 [Streptomyces sp. M92]
MAFPEDSLGLRVELLIDGTWTDITADVYTRDPITHQRGIRNEGTAADPAAVPMTLNNKSGKYSNRNPMSPYYGLIGRNTRVRLSLPGEESYLQLDGDPTSYASTPDDASLDITGDLDIRWEGEADWYATGVHTLIGKWDTDPAARSYILQLQDGNLRVQALREGLASGPFGQAPLPVLPRRAALRATLDAGTGVIRLYWAPTLDDPWTPISGDIAVSAPVTIASTTAPLYIAPTSLDSNPPRQPMAGRTYRAEVRAGIDGPLVAAPDFRTQTPDATSFTDSAGRAWTLSGAAEIRDRVDRFIGEISEWPQKWVASGADAWVPVQAAGILRRLGQGTKALDSALRRRIPSYGPMAYWPMEEGQNADHASTPIARMDPLYFTQVQWAADSSLPSSAPLPTIASQTGALSHMSGMIRNLSWAPVPVWSVIWMYRMPQVPTTRRTFMLIRSTGTVRDWYVQMGPDNTRLLGVGYEGETLVDRTILTPASVIFGKWIKARFSIEQEGNTVRYILVWQDINGDAIHYENTLPGVIGRPTGVSSPPGGFHPDINGMAIGHISAWTEYDTVAYDNAMSAWTGETAGARMLRLSAEEGLPVTLTGPSSTTEQVGYQDMAPVLGLIRTAADADSGLLTEDQTALRLLYRPRATLYSQEPALVLDYAQGQIAGPLDPVDDDSNIRNDVTVTRDGGSATRVILAEGPLSVLEPPDGVGVYDDAITLSLHDDTQTEPKAWWELHLGTWDEPRYPAVTVNLHRHPELIPAVLAMREGDIIRLTNMPNWVAPGDVDLMVMGLKETLLPRKWEITFNCVPAGPWQVGVVGDGLLGRVDTDGTELAVDVDAAETVLPVTVTAGPTWISANPVLNANPLFADDLTGWTAAGAVIERVPAPTSKPFAGGWALRLTPDGLSQFPNAGSEHIPVVPGQQYTVSGWLRCATTRNVGLNVNWFDAAGTYMTTAPNGLDVEAGTWSWSEMTTTAPAGAATANIAPTVADFPPPTDVLWAHNLTLRLGGGSPRDFPFAVRVGGEVATVTAITATGGATTQLMHVVRSVNGITKPHTAGTDVRLAHPTRLAL